MDGKKYIPSPADLSDVKIPEKLTSLIEELAENVHDVWAKQRYDAGWRYGKERDDQLLLHPCLCAYSELPNEEKEYDRLTASVTIKSILAIGYEIRK